MQTASTGYANPYIVAAQSEDVRVAFVRKAYVHLALAIAAFAVLEAFLLQIPGVPELAMKMTSGWSWLVVLGAFMAVSWIADRWANSATSQGLQYAGLGLYVVAEAIIFLPLLVIANYFATEIGGPYAGIIGKAAFFTLLLVAGLTAIVFTTKKDFSFISSFLKIGFIVALGLIVCSIVFGFNLGWVFSAAMILLAAGSILYTTSNILHHYRTDQYVAASLALFAGVALLFWYVLQLLLHFGGDD
jgi:FtsH-binding integral membrane protein